MGLGSGLIFLASLATSAGLPQRLSETGLYAEGAPGRIHPQAMTFTPQYPLWSDGTTKRRWLRLPPGTTIDASDADAWKFPPGTRLWKEFSHGRPIETRMIERLPDGSWRFSVYVWNEQGTEAILANENGIAALPAATAPGGKYRILAQADCRACHEAANVPVLGFSALQLSPDRDPMAANAFPMSPADVDLPGLVSRGEIINLSPEFLKHPPRITARTRVERAALGYLHGNCGHCHSRADSDPLVPVDLVLEQRVSAGASSSSDVLASLVDAQGEYRMAGAHALVSPGHPERSTVALRMKTRNPMARMPPLGTAVPDPLGVELIEKWIRDLPPKKEAAP
ncbi:MAG: hypothetical protein A3E01_05780 [Gammaproteobacteria bacterium RIFCSPHIGHO2_12_FULL_63_22]|nr:MAG: hypothetical protein A3E01_05780 [Gammaproteobacteria bacterium RIFCSPHIGHO2_12_FULL_63_22]